MNGHWSNTTDPITIAKVYFSAGQTYRSIKRIYYKFSELIAETTSLIEGFLIVFYFFCSSINEMLSFKLVMQKTMKFKKEGT